MSERMMPTVDLFYDWVSGKREAVYQHRVTFPRHRVTGVLAATRFNVSVDEYEGVWLLPMRMVRV